MRISDWSSDVCSSDLTSMSVAPQRSSAATIIWGMAMNISLYDATVRGFVQTVGAVQGFLERALKHCAATGLDPGDIVATRLYPHMLPFRFQKIGMASMRERVCQYVRVTVGGGT